MVVSLLSMIFLFPGDNLLYYYYYYYYYLPNNVETHKALT